MPARDETERDPFDRWIGQVLRAGLEDVQPSSQVWRRIARTVRASQAWLPWRRRWADRSLSAWSLELDQRDRFVDSMRLTSMGWWILYLKPCPYA